MSTYSERLKTIVGDRKLREFVSVVGGKYSTVHSYIMGKKGKKPTKPSVEFLEKVIKTHPNLNPDFLYKGELPVWIEGPLQIGPELSNTQREELVKVSLKVNPGSVLDTAFSIMVSGTPFAQKMYDVICAVNSEYASDLRRRLSSPQSSGQEETG